MKRVDQNAVPKGIRGLLQEELLTRCQKNPQYSLRAFAKTLKIDSSALSQILRGTRPVGRKLAQRLGLSIGLSPEVIAGINGKSFGKKRQSTFDLDQITLDTFHVVSEWYHHALVEMAKLKFPNLDAVSAARYFELNVNVVNAALERLHRLGFITLNKSGAWKVMKQATQSRQQGDFTNEALRRLQKNILAKAIEQIDHIPLGKRDNCGLICAGDSSKMKEVSDRISAFVREIHVLLETSKNKDTVYLMGVAVTPLQSHKGDKL